MSHVNTYHDLFELSFHALVMSRLDYYNTSLVEMLTFSLPYMTEISVVIRQ